MEAKPQVELTQLPELVLIGHSFRVSATASRRPEEIPALWEDFFHSGRRARLPEPVLPGVLVACCHEEGEDGSFTYLIAVPARADAQPTGDQERLVLPGNRYARVTARGEMSRAIPETFRWFHENWLPTSSLQQAEGPELEWYDHRVTDGADAEVDIFVPIK